MKCGQLRITGQHADNWKCCPHFIKRKCGQHFFQIPDADNFFENADNLRLLSIFHSYSKNHADNIKHCPHFIKRKCTQVLLQTTENVVRISSKENFHCIFLKKCRQQFLSCLHFQKVILIRYLEINVVRMFFLWNTDNI